MYCCIFICVYSSLARVETSEQQILAWENRYGPKATLTIEGSEREARSYINAFSDLQTNVGFYWTEIENILSKLGQSNIASPSAQYDKLHLIFFVPSFFLERITPNFLCVAFYFKLLALSVYLSILKIKK